MSDIANRTSTTSEKQHDLVAGSRSDSQNPSAMPALLARSYEDGSARRPGELM